MNSRLQRWTTTRKKPCRGGGQRGSREKHCYYTIYSRNDLLIHLVCFALLLDSGRTANLHEYGYRGRSYAGIDYPQIPFARLHPSVHGAHKLASSFNAYKETRQAGTLLAWPSLSLWLPRTRSAFSSPRCRHCHDQKAGAPCPPLSIIILHIVLRYCTRHETRHPVRPPLGRSWK